ncbi:hypothetical protein [Desulfosediminicola ganghwensis]|uniref:hypothetical protein n=1 Tax=Desulfosediminicola ganghwensis TaxID=2569540 RepID=UPI0010AD24C1|nr:hypothetical protein [Desulfosediminicola ganghwensis]
MNDVLATLVNTHDHDAESIAASLDVDAVKVAKWLSGGTIHTNYLMRLKVLLDTYEINYWDDSTGQIKETGKAWVPFVWDVNNKMIDKIGLRMNAYWEKCPDYFVADTLTTLTRTGFALPSSPPSVGSTGKKVPPEVALLDPLLSIYCAHHCVLSSWISKFLIFDHVEIPGDLFFRFSGNIVVGWMFDTIVGQQGVDILKTAYLRRKAHQDMHREISRLVDAVGKKNVRFMKDPFRVLKTTPGKLFEEVASFQDVRPSQPHCPAGDERLPTVAEKQIQPAPFKFVVDGFSTVTH